ncbi:MAG: adenine deaminase [Chloroflexi bacterium]|nr:adenine deaminase [Chloroflexota bacterium]
MNHDVASIPGNIVDVVASTIYPGTLEISHGRIIGIRRERKTYGTFLVPGLVDSHVHIESSMLVPSEFARLAVMHGTVATVSDPHEIANVLGMDGIRYMIENGKAVPFKFCFGAPSCVPATPFETAGAGLGLEQVDELLRSEEVKYLSEMMNFPGVLNGDPEVMGKIALARKYGKPVDGHAPGLRGVALQKYVGAGISTDHETLGQEEALEKLRLGMKLLIREGSAAKSLDVFADLIEAYPEQCMFCTDDIHPDDLVMGHINDLVKRALKRGIDRMKVLRCASLNPARHYGLDVGLLQRGDSADLVEIDDFEHFNVLRTYVAGQLVAENGETMIPHKEAVSINAFRARKKTEGEFSVKAAGERIAVIEAIDGQLLTNRISATPKVSAGTLVSDTDRDILKMTVVNRYQDAPPALAFVRGFGLKRGAIASSVAHDSHNVIAVGVTDQAICEAVNLIIEHQGGVAVVSDGLKKVLPLPEAGIMTTQDGLAVARQYSELNALAKHLGARLNAPFMTLSFMALLVIPRIKLSDRGLFDVESFSFMSLFE